jgi:hypothetical protein
MTNNFGYLALILFVSSMPSELFRDMSTTATSGFNSAIALRASGASSA